MNALLIAAVLLNLRAEDPTTRTIKVFSQSVASVAYQLGLGFHQGASLTESVVVSPGTRIDASIIDRIPAGLESWVVEDATNSLVLTGTKSAIDEIAARTKLLDVPSILARFEIQVIKMNETARKLAGLDLANPDQSRSATLRLPPDDARRLAENIVRNGKLRHKGSIQSINNRQLNYVWSFAGTRGVTSILPRINGDETVSLSIGVLFRLAGDDIGHTFGVNLRRRVDDPVILLAPSDTAIIITAKQIVKPQ